MKNRIISIILCVMIIVSICGCSSQNSKSLTENDLIGQDGCFLYTIVSAEENTDIEGADKEALNLKKQIGEAFDIKVNSSTDDKNKADSESYEILLGNTNRKESKTAYETLKNNRIQNIDDWMIKVIGNKICIVATDNANLAKAVRYFNVNFCTKLSDFSKVTDDFQYIDMKKYDVSYAEDVKIAGNKITDYTIITPREKSLLYTLKISKFVETFSETYGIKIKQGRDTETENGKYEIIIGNTNRSESKGYKLGKNKYSISVVDDKLVINGGSDIAIAAAVQKILDLEEKARKSNVALEIPKDFKEEGTVKEKNGEYTSAWADEFNGRLDRTVWKNIQYASKSKPSANGGSTYYRGDENIFTKNGCAVLPSKRLNSKDFENSGMATQESFAYRYGIIEVRAKLPQTPMTAAIWGAPPSFSIDKNGKRQIELTPKNYLEFDMFENFGQPDWLASNVHQWIVDGSKHRSLDGTKYAELKKYVFPEGKAFYDDFHIFSCEWTPNGFKFAIDGDVYFNYDTSTLDNIGFTHCPIDIRFDGGYSDASYYLSKKVPDDAPKYDEYLIDYVRVYQSNSYDNILWFDPVKG